MCPLHGVSSSLSLDLNPSDLGKLAHQKTPECRLAHTVTLCVTFPDAQGQNVTGFAVSARVIRQAACQNRIFFFIQIKQLEQATPGSHPVLTKLARILLLLKRRTSRCVSLNKTRGPERAFFEGPFLLQVSGAFGHHPRRRVETGRSRRSRIPVPGVRAVWPFLGHFPLVTLSVSKRT
jgi:hypothetical protein